MEFIFDKITCYEIVMDAFAIFVIDDCGLSVICFSRKFGLKPEPQNSGDSTC